ncbi:MAG: glutamine-hydrolyzing GMP synthase [Anaerolineaceae bacterium]|jgi:GMP synthase (glutamine-hydrolysing)|nr:glutamine-hydrolyzing GMP synthase [Anaerolineaceae bacterium]
MNDTIIVLDFGSQYSQLITRRVREARVYAEMFPWNAPQEQVLALQPKGFILSGGPNSAYEVGAPYIPDYVLASGLPILGICYGMQAITVAFGGKVARSQQREYGMAEISVVQANPLIADGDFPVWMSHADRLEALPPGFVKLAVSRNSPYAAMGDLQRHYYGVQFHPEVRHTPSGVEMIRRFAVEICGAQPNWTAESIIEHSVSRIRAQVGQERVLVGVSGGVDSSVAAALVQHAIGDQLVAVFVDHGLLRQDERQQVEKAFKANLGVEMHTVDAIEEFMHALDGVTDPEAKRRAIGATFIRIFEQAALEVGKPRFLVQGTIYPDVIESSAPDRNQGHKIKSHHNVGGLPEDLSFELVEPLRYLFKDEVRAVGEALGLPVELVWRQPFPGPGLAVRCLGEINMQRLATLRAADAIFTEELTKAGLLGKRKSIDVKQPVIAQAFAVLLPVRSVGVMGDARTYQEAIALRAVATDDFMTADWARLDYDLLARVASRIVNEVSGVNRVVYDITSKPPATIEWE